MLHSQEREPTPEEVMWLQWQLRSRLSDTLLNVMSPLTQYIPTAQSSVRTGDLRERDPRGIHQRAARMEA